MPLELQFRPIIIGDLHNFIYPPIQKLSDLDSCRSLLLWQRSESEVWLDNAELGEQSLGLLVLDAGVDDNIIARNPVDWSGDTVLVAGLKGVDNTEDLGSITASRGRVREDEADGLLWVNDKDRADSERNALGVDVGRVLMVEPRAGSTRSIAIW
jgi:hypothetical protein